MLKNLVIGDGARDSDSARYSDGQIGRDAILIAIPRGNTTFVAGSLEVVPKKAVPATLIVPGYDVTGSIYMLPDVDPAGTPFIGGHHFAPMTDVKVTPAKAPRKAWQEPLLIVNLARTLLYAPKP
jgi:hypothetical protein